MNPILHGLFLHPNLRGEEPICTPPLCNFKAELVEQKYLVGVVGLTLNFFLITNWGDDVTPQVDDVTILVKKRYFFSFAQVFITIRSIVQVLIFKGYFIV